MRSFPNEIWKEIPDGEGALVSNFGRIRRKNKLLNYREDKDGYYTVSLGSKLHRQYVHRICAKVWLDEPDNPKAVVVDHIDGDKHNNITYGPKCNLRWCTYSENTKAAYDLGLIKKSIKGNIVVKKIDTGTIKVFDTLAKAAIWAKADAKIIEQIIRGVRKTTKGVTAYKVIEENDNEDYYVLKIPRRKGLVKKHYRQMVRDFINAVK